ncbi:MAG: hypothetical protein ACETWG_06700 [Candidatus Neomarinimicrobiota bacterium]
MKRLLLLALLTCFACTESEAVNELYETDEICGTWVLYSEEGGVTVFKRTDELAVDNYGIVFRTDGSCLERKNAGWCGTPPITYADFEGTWERLSENILAIEVGYWNGTMTYQLEIVELRAEELKVRYHYSD